MAFYPTQSDINLLFQQSKKIYSRIELLNKDYMVIGALEGELLSDSYNIDSTSNIRRTYNCTLQVKDSSLLVGTDKKIWFDKLIRPYVGIYSARDKAIKWYPKGTYAYGTATYTYNSENRTLSLQCNDLMCMLTGDCDGVQPALSFSIPVGSDIRTSIIGILKAFGFTKYRIDDLPRNVQYDLEFPFGTTAYDMITELMQFCPNFEYFFDIDGTFVVQRIPCYTDDPDILDDNVFQNLLISEDSYELKFGAKNCIEIWGKTYSNNHISHYTDHCTYSNNTYTASFEAMTELKDYMVIGIKIPKTNQADFKVNLNNIKTFTVKDDYGMTMKANLLEPDTTYLFLYRDNNLYYLGQFNIHAIYKNEDSNSPFSIEKLGREVWAVYSEGEYENIVSDTLAKERAMYECYYKGNLNEILVLTLVDIPWLDVNRKVTYTLKSTGETYRWMINNISGDTISGKCSITLSRFYPDWSEIFRQDTI